MRLVPMLLGGELSNETVAIAAIIGFVILAGLIQHVVRNYIYRRLDK